MGFITDLATESAVRVGGVLKAVAAGIVGRVLSAFGLSAITLNTVLPDLKAFVTEKASLLPADKLQFLSAIGLDVAMTMILSALAIRMAWKVFIVPTSIANALPGAGS